MRLFGVTVMENLRPRWNVAPSQQTVMVRQSGLHPEAMMARWGLPPATSKHSFLINARMETVTQKPTFSHAFATSRCIIPASGWYEWSAPKRPWHVQRRDGAPMGFAGLWFDRGGHIHFVVMTSAADGDLQNIHHRAPLVLARDEWQNWLGAGPDTALGLCRAAPASWFNWYRVDAAVGKVAADHPELVTPLTSKDIAAEEAAVKSAARQRSQRDDHQGDLFG